MAKKSNGGAANAAVANAGTKSRKPRIKGENKPKNVHKAFRSSGNGCLIRAALGIG